MNPSSKGWIAKFGTLVADKPLLYGTVQELYLSLRDSGFVYGIYKKILNPHIDANHYSDDEIAKIVLIDALYTLYKIQHSSKSFNLFINEACAFYDGILYKDFQSPSTETKLISLEKVIHHRVVLDNNIFRNTVNKNTINSLLMIDVLAFKSHLKGNDILGPYISRLERVIFNLTYNVAMHTYNQGNLKSAETYASVFGNTLKQERYKSLVINRDYLNSVDSDYDGVEKLYFLDVCSFICYSDWNYNKSDFGFLETLRKNLGLTENVLDDSKSAVILFFTNHPKLKTLLSKSNMLTNIHKNSSLYITRLILRNKKRIFKEAAKSQELMNLLFKSKNRRLTLEEQARIQTLIKEIVRSIPSLAIFLLPGGAILLPLFAKLLPDLMPSSFDDNK